MPLNPNSPITYLTKFNFTIEIGGIVRAGFMKCGAITVETEMISIREGGNPFPVTMPGLSTFSEITLERGMVAEDFDLLVWSEDVSNSRTQTGLADNKYKRDLDIVLRNAAKVAKVRWRLGRAWPRVYTASDLDTSASEVQGESVTLVYESMERKIL